MNKKSSSRRMNVSARMGFVISSGFFILVAIILCWLVLNYAQNDLNSLQQKVNGLKYSVLSIREAELTFISNAPADAGFLQSGKSKDIDTFQLNLNNCYRQIGMLKTSSRLGFIFIGEELDSLDSYLKNHAAVLIQISDALYRIGSSENGLLGELNQSYQNISNAVISMNNPGGINVLPAICLAENEFVLSKNPAARFKLESAIDELSGILESVKGDPATIQLLGDDLEMYKRIAGELSEQYKLFGSNADNGNILTLEKSYGSVISSTNSIVSIINEKLSTRKLMYSGIALVIIISLALLYFLFLITMRNAIVTPLNKLNKYLKLLEDGSIPEADLVLPGNSEFNDIAQSFNIRMASLRKAVIFANNIKQKKYGEDFHAISDQDNLSGALLAMRESLKANELEVQTRTILDNQQKWVSSGIAVIGEVLNKNYKNSQDFGFSIISTLVKYLDANQGGIFFINDENPKDIHLECKASFAYDRRRYLQKRLEMGEGYVGTCVLEKKSIFNKEIPKDYIVITSGLGDAPPKILMVIPLISDNEVFGAIEIASFKLLEDYQMEFVERACENIATTIAGVRIKEQTEQLYKATKEQSEKIAQDEEEMRQNLEEMQATQEEAYRREKQLRQQLNEAQSKIQELENRLQ